MSFAPSRRLSAVLVVLLAGTVLVGPSSNPAAAVRSSVVTARSGTNPPTPGNFTGKAFDQCSAPSQRAMNAWRRHSPYRGIGVYISGSLRACEKQRNLTARWVRAQLAHGWKLLPIHVGRQASCTHIARFRSHRISAKSVHGYAKARAQGRSEAISAARSAHRLGLAAGSTIFYDLEGFKVSGRQCRDSTLQFLSAWTRQLGARGYTSGVYSGASSGIRLLDKARASGAPVTLPHRIWLAEWDGEANTHSSHLRSTGWPNGRIKQYRGDHTERHGGVSINIDSNYVDLRMPSARGATPPKARHSAKHSAKRPAKRPAQRPAKQSAKRPAEHPRWVYLPGRSTPEAEHPVADRVCTTRRINQASYPSTGVFRRPWLHASLQCVLKQNGLYDSPVSGYWGPRTAYGVRRLQDRADRAVRTTMTRGDWVALLVAGHDRSWLVRGVRGADVVRLQRALHAAGVQPVYITGRYDRATVRAVHTYQRQVGIRSTGTVGRRTWHYLARGRI